MAKPIELPDESTTMSVQLAGRVLQFPHSYPDEEVLQACNVALGEIKLMEAQRDAWLKSIDKALKDIRNRIRVHMSEDKGG